MRKRGWECETGTRNRVPMERNPPRNAPAMVIGRATPERRSRRSTATGWRPEPNRAERDFCGRSPISRRNSRTGAIACPIRLFARRVALRATANAWKPPISRNVPKNGMGRLDPLVHKTNGDDLATQRSAQRTRYWRCPRLREGADGRPVEQGSGCDARCMPSQKRQLTDSGRVEVDGALDVSVPMNA